MVRAGVGEGGRTEARTAGLAFQIPEDIPRTAGWAWVGDKQDVKCWGWVRAPPRPCVKGRGCAARWVVLVPLPSGLCGDLRGPGTSGSGGARGVQGRSGCRRTAVRRSAWGVNEWIGNAGWGKRES